jgi:biofilm PGA synthesis N-glycosyltransferase PgaC
MKCVLITPAHNEARFIAKTLASMVAQTVPPERWVIVDDGSTDNTAEIIQGYAKRYPWIELVQRPQRPNRNFAAKVEAFNLGLERLGSVQFDVIGNLDGDVSFEPGYMEFLMRKFIEDPELAVAGTPFIEDDGYDSAKDSFEGENYVAGPCQLFRYECFKDIGGYVPHAAGGIDWIAVMTARMKGWKVRSFPDKRFHHHRSLGTAGRSSFAASFSYGEKDYYLGNSPVWELFRVAYRMAKPPLLVDGLALLLGYCWAAVRRVRRPVSRELMQFHRRDEMKKLRTVLRRLIAFKKVDSFRLRTKEADL